MNSNCFGEKLKNYRTAMNLTQTDLGKMLDLSQVTIANYERGERFPRQNILLSIAKLFDVSLDTMLEAPVPHSGIRDFPDDYRFDTETLIKMLLTAPPEDALTYTSGWKTAAGFDLASFYEQIITPALIRTGELWFSGELLVSEEHLISDKIRELIVLHANREWERKTVKPVKNKTWMGFCAPGEKHELALLMSAQILRLAGWHVYYLGTQVPFADLCGIIRKFKPTVLGISITLPENLEGLNMYIRQIREEFGNEPAIILGGHGAGNGSETVNSLKEGAVLAESLFNNR